MCRDRGLDSLAFILALLLVFDLWQVSELHSPCVLSRGPASPCLGVGKRIRGEYVSLLTAIQESSVIIKIHSFLSISIAILRPRISH